MLETGAGLTEEQVRDYIRRGQEHLWIHTAAFSDLADPERYLVFAAVVGFLQQVSASFIQILRIDCVTGRITA
jgi:hypothetical protein